MNALGSLAAATLAVASAAHAQPLAFELDAALEPLSRAEAPAVLATLRALTAPDSGTGQEAGIVAVADRVERMARSMGGEVQRLQPAGGVVGPNLLITFKGQGERNILLMSHMDTVYPPGTSAARPFRVEGARAFAPGIADDKGGIAVFLHAMKLLQARGFDGFGRVTMLFTSDEEAASAGSRDLIRAQAQAHDFVLNGEPTGAQEALVLGTSGAGRLSVRVSPRQGHAIEELADVILRTRDVQRSVDDTRMNWTVVRAEDPQGLKQLPEAGYDFATLVFRVKGRASHAGVAPDAGINAVVEIADIVRRVGRAAGTMPQLHIHWRSLSGGGVSNMIPEFALAVAELAVPRGVETRAMLESLGNAASYGMLSGAEIVVESRGGLAAAPPVEPHAFASADVRVPDAQAFADLARVARERIAQQKFGESQIAVQDALVFPAFNASPQGRQLVETARAISDRLGMPLRVFERSFGATDAAWAAQSGKPVMEGLGLAGGNYHSPDEEFIFVDRIPRRLQLAAEMIRMLSRQR